jgi:benzoate membrane transport protein
LYLLKLQAVFYHEASFTPHTLPMTSSTLTTPPNAPPASELRGDLSISAIVAGFIAVAVSYAGPLVLAFQVADSAHWSPAIVSSWVWAISMGAGITALSLSWWYRAPVITAWSTPGAALLVGALTGVPFEQAVGAYLVSAVVVLVFGVTGWFGKLMQVLPKSIAGAMLAGILLRFGTEAFASVGRVPLLAGGMCAAWLVLRKWSPRYAIPGVLLLGVLLAWAQGDLAGMQVRLELAQPVFTWPVFTWASALGVGLPLAAVTLTGQFVPGVAVMRAAGYNTPANPLVTVNALVSLVLAPFGAHAINLAAITAAICTGPEAHHNPAKRYVAGMACGVFYLLIGAFGATLVALFAALPKALVACVAGLALFGAILNGLATAMADEQERDSALLTFLVTASGVTLLGLGSAFWGLVAGVVMALYGRRKN